MYYIFKTKEMSNNNFIRGYKKHKNNNVGTVVTDLF